jgi:hypothetical protein
MLGSLSEERGRDDGFLDRCLFSFPEPSAFPPQRWNEAELSEDAERDWSDALGRLADLSMIEDEDGAHPPRPFLVRFAPEAKRLWAEWFDAHAGESAAADFPDDLAGAWSKMKAHAARFALILSRLRLACDPDADPGRGRSTPRTCAARWPSWRPLMSLIAATARSATSVGLSVIRLSFRGSR